MECGMCSAARVGAFALALVAPAAGAQDTVRVRGTIERVDGSAYVVRSREGAELKVLLAEKAPIVALVKASLADIKPGSFVGVTGIPQPDGRQKAVEIHIFPESMRGTGEGHRPWDLLPDSTMTNANVEHAVSAVDGQTIRLKYKDGEKTFTVSPDVPIVNYVAGDKGELKPGVKVFVSAAAKQPDGSLLAPRMNYGKDGLTPPM